MFKVARVLGRNFPLVLLLVMIGTLFWSTDRTEDTRATAQEGKPDGFHPPETYR